MNATRLLSFGAIATGVAVVVALSVVGAGAGQQSAAQGINIDGDDIGGVVTSTNGPEAGVWVIAETNQLSTKFSRIVVTDDRGRYVLPDLPRATYEVWVRGYGLVDSPRVQAAPGKMLNLKAVVAPSPRAAAEYYPGNYWYSLIKVPDKSEFPGTGAAGNGINENMKSQAQWIRLMKTDSCESCHQIGSKGTREIPKALGTFPSSVAAWERRIQSGQASGAMTGGIAQIGTRRALAMFADWTDRIAAGEYPHEAPPRPQGVERNVVITQWDWADPKRYLHDEIATDKRNPTVNANGPLYGALEASADYLSVLDPRTHSSSRVEVPVRDLDTPYAVPQAGFGSSAYWGSEPI